MPTYALMALAVTSSIVLALSGCASSAGIAPSAQPVAPASVGIDAATTAPAVATDWWKAFSDPALDDLVAKAVAGSPTLKVAQARLARAQAAVAGAQSRELPQVNGVGNATRERFSANGIFPAPLGGNWWTNADLEADVSWELDFFGRNQAAIEAAVGTARAAQADVDAARVLLASNVARGYVQLARLIEQHKVAERSLAQRDEVLGLIRQRVQGGLDTNVELRQGEESLPETRQQIEQLDEQITLTRHALAALTVQPPDALASLSPPLTAVHAVPVPANVPADLLGRRADIAAARWRVEAATSDVKAAKAEFYPNINLTAAIGLTSLGFDNLFKGSSRQIGFGPALSLPIFDAGRLRANLRGKTADVDAAVESYNGAVIDAVHDVADQLASLRSIDRQQTEQARAQEAAESAYDLATQRYKAGLGTYLVVLNAESTVLAQRRLAADLKARALDTQVALIRALGGGYVPTEGPADTPLASAH
ncbi:MAG: efflux transporter outer membrane subunit [Proteobacteria bacterium]|nr:efflux transporter outer membrane subunit [Pseudomonadota bacterium]